MLKIKKLLGAVLISGMMLGCLSGCGSEEDIYETSEDTEAAVEAEDTEIAEEAEESEEISYTEAAAEETEAQDEYGEIEYGGYYTSKDDVALYIYTYGELPDNYITKSEAKALGWESSKGNLDEVAPGMSIGGDRFGNYEGLLPDADGRKYYECDINYEGGYRGGERIVFSNDGLIYYSADHYEDFELLYE